MNDNTKYPDYDYIVHLCYELGDTYYEARSMANLTVCHNVSWIADLIWSLEFDLGIEREFEARRRYNIKVVK